ncbi:MAG: VF530 family protein [Sulfuricellaceae bacterium]|nr:VF530 family protein [Sulfuricellaceae bacterium]
MSAYTKPANLPSLDGITLETIVTRLSENMGWEAMAAAIPVRCFTHDPSIKSSLKFLRRTPWARKKVEQLYLQQAQTFFKFDSSCADG